MTTNKVKLLTSRLVPGVIVTRGTRRYAQIFC